MTMFLSPKLLHDPQLHSQYRKLYQWRKEKEASLRFKTYTILATLI